MKYRIIIAGPRWYADYDRVKRELRYFVRHFDTTEIEIVSGRCDVPGLLTFTTAGGINVYGADGIGERLAKENDWPVKAFPADWKLHGKSAGPIRNDDMAVYANYALIFTDWKSKGTSDIIRKTKRRTMVTDMQVTVIDIK